jgi:hypothetical protein
MPFIPLASQGAFWHVSVNFLKKRVFAITESAKSRATIEVLFLKKYLNLSCHISVRKFLGYAFETSNFK